MQVLPCPGVPAAAAAAHSALAAWLTRAPPYLRSVWHAVAEMTPEAFQGFVFAICPAKLSKIIKARKHDLNAFSKKLAGFEDRIAALELSKNKSWI